MTVSVIIPAFNAADVLPTTVPSVLALSGVHQFVWVNDGSTDETGRLLESLIQGHPHATVIQCEENRGRAAARNAGVELATGDVIAFLDADARPRGGYIEAHLQALNSPDAVASMGRIVSADPVPGDPYSSYLNSFARGPAERSGATPWKHLVTCAVCVEANALQRTGLFNEDIRYGEDAELACRFADQHPVGLHVAQDAVVDLFGTANLKQARQKAFEFGQALQKIQAIHPRALVELDLVRLEDPVFSTLLKSRQLAWIVEAGLRRVPSRVQAPAVRYLLGHSLYRGYTHA